MRNNTQKSWIEMIDESLINILKYLGEGITYKDIASKASYSEYHFHRNFKKFTGESVADCIRRLKLEKAVYLLRHTKLRVIDIAVESGFETLEAFTKAFTKTFGMSPSRLRKFPMWDGKARSVSGIHYSKDIEVPDWFPVMLTGGINMDIKIVDLSPMKFVCLRNTGDYWKLPQTWQNFHSKLREQGAYWPGSKFMILFHDHNSDAPMENRKSDTSMTIYDGFIPKDGLFTYDFPGGKYAVVAHFGSYEEIGNTDKIWKEEWLPNSGWVVETGLPFLEWYQNDPNTTPPELLLTLLCTPVKKER